MQCVICSLQSAVCSLQTSDTAPASSRIICGGISSTSASSAPAEMKVMIIVNGNGAGNDYIITKPSLAYS